MKKSILLVVAIVFSLLILNLVSGITTKNGYPYVIFGTNEFTQETSLVGNDLFIFDDGDFTYSDGDQDIPGDMTIVLNVNFCSNNKTGNFQGEFNFTTNQTYHGFLSGSTAYSTGNCVDNSNDLNGSFSTGTYFALSEDGERIDGSFFWAIEDDGTSGVIIFFGFVTDDKKRLDDLEDSGCGGPLEPFIGSCGSDSDGDGVSNNQDICPNSRFGEEVDQFGCDPFQFCGQFSCGTSCSQADWQDNEGANPNDCVTAFKADTGQPVCVPTTCGN